MYFRQFWDALGGDLKCVYEDSRSGVTAVCFFGLKVVSSHLDGALDVLELETSTPLPPPSPTCSTSTLLFRRVVSSHLDGTLDFLELETFTPPARSPAGQHQGAPASTPPLGTTPPSSAAPAPGGANAGGGGAGARPRLRRKGHVRHQSIPTLPSNEEVRSWTDCVRCVRSQRVRAHAAPVSLMVRAGARLITAGHDANVMIYRVEDSTCLFSLTGHTSAITALSIDEAAPGCCVSGARDGTVIVWDVLSGACVHRLTGHNGAVLHLSISRRHVISCGVDDRLCVWGRSQGELLHCIQLQCGMCSSLTILAKKYVITGGQGSLFVWDISRGYIVRQALLGNKGASVFVSNLHKLTNNSVVCDYGDQLRIVNFPNITDKSD